MAGPSDQSAAMQLTLVSTNNLSPSQYVDQLQSGGKILRSEGRTETINGSPAWVGRVYVQDSQGQTGSLVYAMVRQSASRAFQVLGQTQQAGNAAEQQILDSARSIRRLTDANRLAASPAHLKIVAAPRSGTFASVLSGIGSPGAPIAELALINGVEESDPVQQGQLLKTVTAGRLR
jgi:predicted Zn-dependent protease